MVFVGIIEWVVVGLLVGYVASKMVNLRGDDPRLGMFAGVGGAVVAAGLYSMITRTGVALWVPWGLAWAAAGAVAGTAAWHAVRSRSVSRERYVPRSSY